MVAAVESMAYVGAVPWHGLGNKVEEDISLEEFQKEAGLDWTVSKRPVLYRADDGLGGINSATFKDRFVLARDTDHKPFAVVSSRYKPVQPKEIFAFFEDLLRMHNMKMHTAGSLMDGGRIWCLAQTGDVHKVLGQDRVDGYLLLSTSYDLTLSTLAQFTSVRVVCNNTLQQALGDSTGRVTIPHIKDFNASSIHDRLGIGRGQWEAFTKALDTIAKVKVDFGTAKKVIDNVFEMPEDPEKYIADSDRLHVSKIMEKLMSGNYKGSDLAANDTAWGVLNSVTEYVDFEKRARGQGSRLNNAWFGDGAKLKQNTLESLLELAA